MSPSSESIVHARIWRRAAAVLALAALVVIGPVLVRALVGSPVLDIASLRDAWRTGRLDDHAVVQVGALLFAALWGWFLLTAMAEAWQVLRWTRTRQRAPLPIIAPSPSSWVRQLVRVALVSTTAIAVSGLAPMHARTAAVHASSAPAGRAAAVISLTDVADPWSAPSGRPSVAAPGVIARGRDTPYSIAARLGDPSLRDRIIELNTGRPGPDGTPWSGGVFPAGMSIDVPDGAAGRIAQDATWVAYTVQPGDSVYAIAADLTHADHRTVTEVADQIIRHNLGRSMEGGRVFDDPSVIVAGWVLDVPSPAAESAPGHVVVAGDSYWRIATERLESTNGAAPPTAVAALVDDLRGLNAPLLGHDDPNLIVPGELVRWADDIAPTAAPEEAVPDTAAPPSVITVDAPAGPVLPHLPELPEFPPRPTRTADAPVAVPVSADESESAVVAGEPTDGAIASAGPAPLTPVEAVGPVVDQADRGVPAPLGLGAAAFVCVGAVALLESRRRDQLRRTTPRSVAPRPDARSVEVETVLRSCTAAERIARLELGLRSAARPLAAAGRHVVGAIARHDGELRLVLDAADDTTVPTAPWTRTADGRGWCLPASARLTELAETARRSAPPCPALVHAGVASGGPDDGADVYVDLEALGLLEVRGPGDSVTAILRTLASSLAVSPVSETLRGVTVGLEPDCHLGNANLETATSVDEALDLAATQLGSTGTLAAGCRTFGLRARSADIDGESWEPVVVIAACDSDDLDDVVDLTRDGGRGLAVVLGVPSGPPAALATDGRGSLRAVPGSDGRAGHWRLEPVGVDLLPVGLDAGRVVALGDLLDVAAAPLPEAPPAGATPAPTQADPTPLRQWELLVELLGHVGVASASGTVATFGRSKSLELTAWLALHRERPTRTAARTALWESDVRPETFANVVSDARRSLARCVAPPDGAEWIERTLTEQLPLHPLVATDADLVQDALARAASLRGAERVAALRPAVELVAGPPFAGTDYLWPHAEGITSSLLLLATSAATELARTCLELGDVDGVFWATGRGLQVVPGHEELIALRMRAHAQRGDLAGVRTEWEVYERALHADPWSAGEPSPKLASVRRELLSS